MNYKDAGVDRVEEEKAVNKIKKSAKKGLPM